MVELRSSNQAYRRIQSPKGSISNYISERYSAWEGDLGRSILDGQRSLDDLAAYVHE